MRKIWNKVAYKSHIDTAGSSFSNKASGHGDEEQADEEHDVYLSNSLPTIRQIYMYRFQRGVNLGGLFTLEPWLTPSLFKDVQDAKSEHDLCRSLDASTVKQRLERHWRTFIDEGDWRWMQANGVNTVRLPISYYHFLPGHSDPGVRALIDETEYANYANIYRDSLTYIVNTIKQAQKYGIGLLIDLHGAPGAQNDQGHSGSSSGQAKFFKVSGKWKKRTIEILLAIAETISHYDNVVGLELLNEPQNHASLPEWYVEAINAIHSRYGARIPLYIGDCWCTEQYANLIRENSKKGFLVMDHHFYRCFTPQDHAKSAHQHAEDLGPEHGRNSTDMLGRTKDMLDGNLVIGEWSAALHHTSLPGGWDVPHERHQAQRTWASAQIKAFHEHCAGFYFWTLKKEGPPDVGWCLYSAVEQDVLPQGLLRPNLSPEAMEAEQETYRDIGKSKCQARYDDHVGYWTRHGNDEPMHHERYRAGFEQIWSDCLAFYTYKYSASTIGFAGRWIAERARANSRQIDQERRSDWSLVNNMPSSQEQRCDSDEDNAEEDWQHTQSASRAASEGEWEYIHGGQQALKEFKQLLQT